MQRVRFVALLLLALGLGSWVYFYEIKGAEERETKADEAKRLFKVTRDEVSTVAVDNQHGHFEFTKADKAWNLTQPLAAPADVLAVDDVIMALDALRSTRVVEEKPADLAAFGLKEPHFKVQLTTASGALTLQVGDEAPFGAGIYLLVDQNPAVYLAAGSLKEKLDKDLVAWRDRKVLDFPVADVQRIRIEGEGLEGLDATRTNGTWTATRSKLRLDGQALEGFLYELQSTQAHGFAGQTDPAMFGLQPPQLTVTLEIGADKTQKQLLVGRAFGNDPRLPAIRTAGEEIRLLATDLLDKLRKSDRDYRATTVVDIQRFKVNRIDATVEGQAVTATRKNDDWTVEGPLKDKVKASDINAILDDVIQLKADATLDNIPESGYGAYDLAAPSLTLAFTLDGSPAPTRLFIGRVGVAPDQKVYVRVEGDPTVYQVNNFLWQDVRDLLLKPAPSSVPAASAPGGVPAPVVAPPSIDGLTQPSLPAASPAPATP